MMKRMIRKIAFAIILVSSSPIALAIDGVAVEVGRGDDHTYLLRVAITDRWHKPERPRATEWRLAGYWEVSAAVWDNHDESTADVGFTPVFRFERGTLYFEAAVGAHLVQTRISAARTFSTAFQFGDHAGLGVYSGRYDFGVRVQHLSNGGVRSPNPGINFVLIRLQYALE